jgi:hypothetical protein
MSNNLNELHSAYHVETEYRKGVRGNKQPNNDRRDAILQRLKAKRDNKFKTTEK